MTPAAFRTWRRSVSACLQLCRLPDREAVQHIRLTCVPALQRADSLVRRCAQMATDCDFKCPGSACDLSEYVLLRKLVVGLGDQEMKRYVFQTCDSY